MSVLLILCWVQCANLKELSFCSFVEGSCDRAASTKQVEGYHQGLLHSLSKYCVSPKIGPGWTVSSNASYGTKIHMRSYMNFCSMGRIGADCLAWSDFRGNTVVF